jgi:hypothetical protein
MEDYLERNGLKLIFKQGVDCPFIYSSLSDGLKSFMGTGPAAIALNHNKKEVVENVIEKAFAPFKLADDIHFLTNRFLVFIATK